MTKEELLAALAECAKNRDYEVGHLDADELLLAYIKDADIAEAFNSLTKWYA